MKTDYHSELLVGAEDWAIDQIREASEKQVKQYIELENLKEYVELIHKELGASETLSTYSLAVLAVGDRDRTKQEFNTLSNLVGQLLDMLETVETSDNETDFHPTEIRSCRVQHTIKLDEIMPKITDIVREK